MYSTYPNAFNVNSKNYGETSATKCYVKRYLEKDFKCSISEGQLRNISRTSPNCGVDVVKAKWIRWGSVVIRLIMLAACLYYSVKFLKEYFHYPTVMEIHKNSDEPATFPTVNFCNANKIRRSYVCDHASRPTFNDYKWKILEGSTSISRKWCNRSQSYAFEEIDESVFSCPGSTNKFLDGYLAMINLYVALTPEERSEASHNISDFVKTCLLHTYECSPSNFTVVHSGLFGNCYRTNFSEDLSTYGMMSGLTLIFDLEVDEYLIDPLNNVYGMILMTSPDRRHIPRIGSDLFSIKPGRRTLIVLEQIIEERLEPPYIDKCRKYDMGSRQDCSYKCWTSKTLANCGCTEPLADPGDSRNCNYMNDTQRCCMRRMRHHYMRNMYICRCPHACKSTYYKIFHSSDIIDPSIYQNQGIGMIHMYLKTADIIYYKSNPKYQVTDFFSNLGGQLGLWLGLSLSEVFVRFYNNVLEKCFVKQSNQNKRRKIRNRLTLTATIT